MNLSDKWTYGAEHEFADWDTRLAIPKGFGRDPEPNICNTNGIATDPSPKYYPFGGEINTPPSKTITHQLKYLNDFLEMHPRACATHRAGLHVHIRVPGLKDNLRALKRIQRFVTDNVDFYPLIDPLPIPKPSDFSTMEEYRGARKRQFWMRMSHWTAIPKERVAKQMEAKSVTQFFELEVPRSKAGKVLWHAQARAAVNLRQLLQTDTIEFRHYSASTDIEEVANAFRWCRDFLREALKNEPDPSRLRVEEYQPLPLTEPYLHWRELRWLATSITKVKRPEVEANIERILDGEFDEVGAPPEHRHLDPRPRGLDSYTPSAPARG